MIMCMKVLLFWWFWVSVRVGLMKVVSIGCSLLGCLVWVCLSCDRWVLVILFMWWWNILLIRFFLELKW